MGRLPGGLYDTYGGDTTPVQGLRRTGTELSLNGQPIRLLSGAIHYFRVHPAYWPDRLAKLRAAGLFCVDTYVPWNLHEPRRGSFDFGDGDDSMSPFLDLVDFLQEAQRQDLLVILRPGPYICADCDLGGLPSWLLREPQMRVRSSCPAFLEAASQFLRKVLTKVAHLTFPRGGPIVALQVENEFGFFGYEDLPRDISYLVTLYDLMTSLLPSSEVLYLTSDPPIRTSDLGAIPGVLQTVNSQTEAMKELAAVQKWQPGWPSMVMEFWSGWYDLWFEHHRNRWSLEGYRSALEEVLQAGASVNVYMFHGGTTFGFLAGIKVLETWPFYAPAVTSYDFDCLLTENGDYTDKYHVTKGLTDTYSGGVRLACLAPPPSTPTTTYHHLHLTRKLTLEDLLDQVEKIQSMDVQAMEDLPINGGHGQSWGCTVYSTKVTVPEGGAAITLRGHVRDLALVLLDGDLISPPCPKAPADLEGFGTWLKRDSTLQVPAQYWGGERRLTLVVENLGRVVFGHPHQFTIKKGLSEGPVLLGAETLKNWNIFPLEFKSKWIKGLTGWTPYTGEEELAAPVVLEGDLDIQGTPRDTFVDACSWNKGAVFVNGFNLGRFWCVGPQKTLYLPAPLLREGKNKVTVWSLYGGQGSLEFKSRHDLGPDNPTGVTPGSGCQVNITRPSQSQEWFRF